MPWLFTHLRLQTSQGELSPYRTSIRKAGYSGVATNHLSICYIIAESRPVSSPVTSRPSSTENSRRPCVWHITTPPVLRRAWSFTCCCSCRRHCQKTRRHFHWEQCTSSIRRRCCSTCYCPSCGNSRSCPWRTQKSEPHHFSWIPPDGPKNIWRGRDVLLTGWSNGRHWGWRRWGCSPGPDSYYPVSLHVTLMTLPSKFPFTPCSHHTMVGDTCDNMDGAAVRDPGAGGYRGSGHGPECSRRSVSTRYRCCCSSCKSCESREDCDDFPVSFLRRAMRPGCNGKSRKETGERQKTKLVLK